MASCELAPKEAPVGQDIATFAGGVQLLAHMPWDAAEHSCFWDTRPAWNGSWQSHTTHRVVSQESMLNCLLWHPVPGDHVMHIHTLRLCGTP